MSFFTPGELHELRGRFRGLPRRARVRLLVEALLDRVRSAVPVPDFTPEQFAEKRARSERFITEFLANFNRTIRLGIPAGDGSGRFQRWIDDAAYRHERVRSRAAGKDEVTVRERIAEADGLADQLRARRH